LFFLLFTFNCLIGAARGFQLFCINPHLFDIAFSLATVFFRNHIVSNCFDRTAAAGTGRI
jgi:hypothetical protein